KKTGDLGYPPPSRGESYRSFMHKQHKETLPDRGFWPMLHKRHALSRREGGVHRHLRRREGQTPPLAVVRNLYLAAQPGVGHIRRDQGAVAEWLKAAVC